jgi:hypothetical protein
MARKIGEANRKNWQWAYDRFLEREAELWATNPSNPNIATGIWPPGMRDLIPNQERQHVSPLGGVAQPQPATATSKEKRE